MVERWESLLVVTSASPEAACSAVSRANPKAVSQAGLRVGARDASMDEPLVVSLAKLKVDQKVG